MKIQSIDKTLHKVIKEIADAYNIKFDVLAENRVIELIKDKQQRHIIGYYFDLNDSSSWIAARYKHIASSIFDSKGIPHIEHRVFLNPSIFSDIEGNWSDMIAFAKQYQYNIVCKPNSGSFGTGVVHVTSQARLEEITTQLFARYSAITLSPYYDILGETRHVILDNECVLIYKKERASLLGNGKDPVSKLLLEIVPSFDTLFDLAEFLGHQEMERKDSISLDCILAEREIYPLGWKYNATKASSYTILSESPYQDLALMAGKALNLTFASVDVVQTIDGPKIIEANAGVSFRKLYLKHYKEVKEVYSKAIRKMFQIE